jgi:hypothetical protein
MPADIQIEQVKHEALDWPAKARSLAVVDTPSYHGAGELLKGIKSLAKQIDEVCDPNIARWHAGHKAAVAEKADLKAPLAEAEGIIKRGLVAYDAAQEQIRQAEQRRLQDEARQVEEQRRIEEAAAMESEAKATGDAQLQAEAEALIAAPVYVAPVQVEKATPVISGISYRTTYSARVVDKLKLVQFVAANPQFLGLVAADMVALNGQARSLKMAMQIPGVVVDEKRDVTAGAGR